MLYKLREGYQGANGSRLTTYIGQFALYPCTAKGRRRTMRAAPPRFVSAIGVRAANVIAWTDTAGVAAVRAH